MSRQNTVLGQLTVHKTRYYHKDIKGATGFTMPTKPEEAYNQMKQSTQKQISQQITFIPFPEIRNAIIVFMNPPPIIQKDQSQILTTEYSSNSQLEKLDQQMATNIAKAYHQRIKLQKLLLCFKKAHALKLLVKQFKNKTTEASDDNLIDTMKSLQRKTEEQKTKIKNGRPEQYEEIQKQKNTEIISLLAQKEQQYQQFNDYFIRLDSTYAQIREFCEQMQKIVPIVWRIQSVPQSKDSIIAQNYIEYFQSVITQLVLPLSTFIHFSEASLQLFRAKVKTRSWAQQTSESQSQQLNFHKQTLKKLIVKFDDMNDNIKLKIYQKMKQISKLDQHIAPGLRNQIDSNMRNYEKFVETYTDVKQICNTKHQWQEFERIISDQERHLSDHMRLNCSLIVYYKPTKTFQQFLTAILKRTYVLQMFNSRLTPIRDALKLINQDYSQMYKKACEGSKSRNKLKKNDVKKVLTVLDRNLKDLQSLQMERSEKVHSEYINHLILSLNLLMGLASD